MAELDGCQTRLFGDEDREKATTDLCIAVNAMALKPMLYQRRMDVCPVATSRSEPLNLRVAIF